MMVIRQQAQHNTARIEANDTPQARRAVLDAHTARRKDPEELFFQKNICPIGGYLLEVTILVHACADIATLNIDHWVDGFW